MHYLPTNKGETDMADITSITPPPAPMSDRDMAAAVIAGGICAAHILEPKTVAERAYRILDALQAEAQRSKS